MTKDEIIHVARHQNLIRHRDASKRDWLPALAEHFPATNCGHAENQQQHRQNDLPHSPCPDFTSVTFIAVAGSRHIWCSTF